jgi:DNA-binding GntR family transcriptional regulator
VSYSLPPTRAEAIARHLREEIVAGRLAPAR